MKTKAYVYGVEKLNGYDAWALFEASALGDVTRAKALLAKDRRLANAQYWYQFPIHMAVYAGHAVIVELLLKHGADPGQSIYTYNSWDRLLLAARERGHRRIESLLRREMKRRFHYAPEFDALKAAIVARDSRQIRAALRRRPKLAMASDALGNSPLHWSVITRQLGLLRHFVDLGTPIDRRRADGQSALLLAANGATDYWHRETRGRSHPSLRNTSVLVGTLLALGAEYTLSVAAAMGDLERAEELLRKDAGLARRLDSARVSPLTHAASAGHLHIVRRLLELGADPNAPEEGAPSGGALFEACRQNSLPIARLLLEHGANPDAGTDSNGCCLTIVQVYHGARARPLQKLLRSHGAYTPEYALSKLEIKQAIRDGHDAIPHEELWEQVLAKRDRELLDRYLDSPRTTPDHLHLSIGDFPRSPALLRRLLARGLDPNQSDWLGKTLLHLCAEKGDRSNAAVLLAAGADINAREVEYQGTPLATAVRSFRDGPDQGEAERGRRMIRFLLDRGAATNLPDDAPWSTPMAWARKRGLDQIVDTLGKHGAS